MSVEAADYLLCGVFAGFTPILFARVLVSEQWDLTCKLCDWLQKVLAAVVLQSINVGGRKVTSMFSVWLFGLELHVAD